MKEDCLFCNIIDKKIPAKLVYEDDKVVAFNDCLLYTSDAADE